MFFAPAEVQSSGPGCENVCICVCVLVPQQHAQLFVSVITKVCSGVIREMFECKQVTACVFIIIIIDNDLFYWSFVYMLYIVFLSPSSHLFLIVIIIFACIHTVKRVVVIAFDTL